jgi:heptosyltransferase-2
METQKTAFRPQKVPRPRGEFHAAKRMRSPLPNRTSITFAEAPEKVLVRGVNWLGDAVMTTPALQRLHEHWPGAHITVLTPAKLADLWRHHPHVHDVLSVESGDSPWTVSKRLRNTSFDLALVLPNSPRSALEVFLGRIPRRVGYARGWRNWMLTDCVSSRAEEVKMRKRTVPEIRSLIANAARSTKQTEYPHRAHHVFQYLHLVEALGAPGLPTSPFIMVQDEEISDVVSEFLRGVDQQAGCLGLNPGAEYGPAKRWPAERFAAAAIQVHDRTQCAWVLLGGRGDAPLTGEIHAMLNRQRPGMPVADLAGRTSLRQLAALLSHCRSVLTNDSGPMHLAAALGTPVVALFGSTSPELTAPGNPLSPTSQHRSIRNRVPCSPCFLRECPIDFRCMNGLEVREVADAVLSTLA